MKTITVSVVLAALLVAAHGQESPDGKPTRQEGKPKPERHRHFMQMWDRVDTNKDGMISLEEFAAMPRIGGLPEEKRAQLFKRLDKDSDGLLSKKELEQMRRPSGKPDQRMRRLYELDTDGSGGVSFEEFKTGELFKKLPPERLEALFKRLDTDGDGQLTPKDRPEHRHGHPNGKGEGGKRDGSPDPRRVMRRLDEDKDDVLTFEEFRKSPFMRDLTEDQQEDRFEALDTNGDMKLSPEEFAKSQARRDGPPPRRPRPDGPPPSPEPEGGDEEMMD